MKSNSEIIIVGAGLIGLSTSLLLEKYNIKSTIIDKNRLKLINNSTDTRTTAVSQGSSRIFEKIGIWNKLKKNAQPIYQIKVSEGTDSDGILFDHRISGEGEMGYIVENKFIKRLLLEKVLRSKLISFSDSTVVKKIERISSQEVKIKTQNSTRKCNLLIGADGRHSQIRELSEIKYLFHDYNQKAYVFNIKHKNNHKGVALERFFPTGPLALLPMNTIDKNKSSVVWTVDNIQSFKDEHELIQNFKIKYQDFFGEILHFSDIKSYPLNVYSSLSYFKDNIVLIGDACQAIHPIAGQGFNLGLRDALVLASSISEAKKLGQLINSNLILSNYSKKRIYDKILLISSTHSLNKLFGYKGKLLSKLRSISLKIFNRSEFLKKKSMLFAMGLTDL